MEWAGGGVWVSGVGSLGHWDSPGVLIRVDGISGAQGKLRGIRRQAAFLSVPFALRHCLSWCPLTCASLWEWGTQLLAEQSRHACPWAEQR